MRNILFIISMLLSVNCLSQTHRPRIFLFVPGAWDGGWDYAKVDSKLIEKAKEKLSTTNLTVIEIAYELGFEHLQSFSKLFKTKTKLSPLQFRQSFN